MKKAGRSTRSEVKAVPDRGLIEYVGDGIIIQDTSYRILHQNSIQNDLYGNHTGEYCYKAYENRDTVCEDCPVERTFQDGKIHRAEKTIKTKKGVSYFELTSSPILDNDGKITAALKVIRDVTHYRGFSKAIQESEKRFRNLIETTSDWVWEVDRKGIYIYASPKVRDILGYEPEEVIGKTPFDLMPASEAVRVSAIFKKIIREKVAFNLLENINIHKDGREVVLETSGVPVLGRNGVLTGYRGIDRDITEQKRTRDELLERMKLAELSADTGVALTENILLRDALQRCTDALARHLDAALARIWTFNRMDETLEMQASAGMYTHTNGAHGKIPLGKYKIGIIGLKHSPILTNNVIGDRHIHDQKWAKRNGIVAFAGYPLIIEGSLAGVMAVFFRKPVHDIVMKALSSVAYIVALGIRNKQSELSLREHQENLTQLVKERTAELITANEKLVKEMTERKILEKLLINIEDRERRRIGRDLHDGLGQLLTGLAFKTQGLHQQLEKKCADESAGAADLSELVDEAKTLVSSLSKGLHPVEADSEGLMRALDELAFFTKKVFGTNCSFVYEKPVYISNISAVTQLYRITQEAVTNAVKHGHPGNITISLARKRNRIAIIVKDDGKGISDVPGRRDGMGLKIMKYRASLINASIDIRRYRSAGTIVTCVFTDTGSREQGKATAGEIVNMTDGSLPRGKGGKN